LPKADRSSSLELAFACQPCGIRVRSVISWEAAARYWNQRAQIEKEPGNEPPAG
jgi:hypothetical protein